MRALCFGALTPPEKGSSALRDAGCTKIPGMVSFFGDLGFGAGT
jgi:hypothetical protein|tara:strand:- start:81 stop:212 length:132 start_codon:yes stop_codon:yes gene_type:complete